MQRDRRKRYSPARHPVLLRRVLLVLCILAVLWLGYSCMMPQREKFSFHESPDAKTGLLHVTLCSSPVSNL